MYGEKRTRGALTGVRVSWGGSPIRRFVVLLLPFLASVAFASPALAHHRSHVPGCNSKRCDRRVAHWLAVHYPPKVIATNFDLCVANKETGEPGSLARGFINEHASGYYSGAFQWEQSKWAAGGGLRYAPNPSEASWIEQVSVFHRNGARGEWTYSNWPTIAGCEQYE